MNAKAVAMCSLFVALNIVLYRVRVPVPSFQFYFWEIPIVIALLLFGFKFGLSVAVLSAFCQALIFPPALGIIFPIWNIIAMSTTLVAVALTRWLITTWRSRVSGTRNLWAKPLIFLVIAALILREAVMPFVNYFMWKFMLPLAGQATSDIVVMGAVTASLIYDAILVLYTVPIGYLVAKRVNVSLRMGNIII
jgi:riboflavin transporter FmnP